jgi:protein SCO1/2
LEKLYVIVGAAAIGALILGSGTAILLQRQGDTFAECRGTTVAGGQIGGPFTLVNGDGQAVTDREVLAKPALIYFGYSFCPDVCPLDNARNAAVADDLAKAGHDVTPIFISVDPKRDTPAVMKEYAANISPKMLALTGSDDQVRAAALAYKVYYNIPKPEDPYYSVDHTTFTYLMLPGRGFMDVFDRDTTEQDMDKRVSCYLDKAAS